MIWRGYYSPVAFVVVYFVHKNSDKWLKPFVGQDYRILFEAMYHLGVDIIEIERVQRAVNRYGEKFLNRIYTEAELEFCRNRVPELAVRFAAKEAVMKALGTGRRGVSWRDIEVLRNKRNAPLLYLHGRARRRAQKLGITELAVSLSHSREYAIATVIGGTT